MIALKKAEHFFVFDENDSTAIKQAYADGYVQVPYIDTPYRYIGSFHVCCGYTHKLIDDTVVKEWVIREKSLDELRDLAANIRYQQEQQIEFEGKIYTITRESRHNILALQGSQYLKLTHGWEEFSEERLLAFQNEIRSQVAKAFEWEYNTNMKLTLIETFEERVAFLKFRLSIKQ